MDDTSYKGASLSAKELLSWRPLRHSADMELDGELSTLVARSRDLIRNNGIAWVLLQCAILIKFVTNLEPISHCFYTPFKILSLVMYILAKNVFLRM